MPIVLLALLVVAVSLPLAAAAPAAAVGPSGTYRAVTLSRSSSSADFQVTREVVAVSSATRNTDGTIPFWTGRSYVYLVPPSGQEFTPGSTYAVAASRGPAAAAVPYLCYTVRSGSLTIDDLQYDGADVLVLAAHFDLRCANGSGTTMISGFVRIGTDAPHAFVVPKTGYAPVTGVTKPSSASVTFTNEGTASTSELGVAAVDTNLSGAADFRIGADGCAGTVLAPGASCTVEAIFERATAGSTSGVVTLPAAGYPGDRVAGPAYGRAVTPPAPPSNVRSFPVAGGGGLYWSPTYTQTGYRVERLAADGSWADISGLLPDTAVRWVDESLAPGASADYRVVAENQAGAGAPSAPVTARRLAADPAAGSVSVLTADPDTGRSPNILPGPVVTGPAKASPGQSWTRSLWTDELGIDMPNLLPGPGEYPVTKTDPELRLSVSYPGTGLACLGTGSLIVDEVLYTAAMDLAVFTGRYRLDCGNGWWLFGEIRINSTHPVPAAAVDAERPDVGRVPVGLASIDRPIMVRNTGTADLEVGLPAFSGPAANDWAVTSNDCPPILGAGATCTVSVRVTPSASGPREADLTIPDSTARGQRKVWLRATGTSIPSAATSIVARGTLTGTDLTWGPPQDTGGTPIVKYVVHRYVGDEETTYDAFAQYDLDAGGPLRWTDPQRPAGASYAVSVVNEIGEGPVSGPVVPSTTKDVVTVIARQELNGPSFLGQVAVPNGAQIVPVFAPGTALIGDVQTTSPDGRSVAFVRGDATGGYSVWSLRTDRAGDETPIKLFDSTAGPGDLAWSPDGTRFAYTRVAGMIRCVDIVALSNGVVSTVGCSLTDPAWHPDAQSLIVHDDLQQGSPLVRVQAKANGARLGTYSGTAFTATHAAVSPDARWLAYATVGDEVAVRSLDGASAASLTPKLANSIEDISWSRDGTRLMALTHSYYGGDALKLVPVNAAGAIGEATTMLQRAYDRPILRAMWQGTGVVIRPVAAVTGPTVSIPLDTSALGATSTITCQLDAGAATSCGSSYSRSGLTSGVHTLRVRAVEPDGRVTVAARTFTTDATPPTTSLTAPTFTATTASSVRIAYSATDGSGVASYDVRYRRAAYNGSFGSYVQPWTGTRSTAVSLSVAPGYEYCIAVRARDVYGNVSAWTAERCFSRPLDDTSLTPSAGWTRSRSSAFYLGTVISSSRYGAALTKPVVARRVSILATRCPGCGSVAVYLGTTRLGTVSLAASTTQRQALIALPALSAARSGTLRIVVTSATGRLVQIDGVAIRRT